MNEIKHLYDGDFIPCEQFNSRPPRYVELVKQIEEKEKSLSVGFSEEQKQILKQIQGEPRRFCVKVHKRHPFSQELGQEKT